MNSTTHGGGADRPASGAANFFLDRTDPLARILELADDAIISIDRDQRIVLFNQGAERMFGYASDEVCGQPLDVLLPQRVIDLHRHHIADFSSAGISSRRMGERREILGRRKNGEEFPAEASISKVGVNGETMFTVIMRDVTQRTLADERLRASLREKEALLKEIHHRVKNNLQVVSSLLGLQARAIPDEATRRWFKESQNRIHSMALLHESLYQSDNLAQIDFPVYIRQLSDHLFRSYGVANERIHLRAELDNLWLDMDSAVPCGLIINELLSNSLKYAFPDGRSGEVVIELRGRENHMAMLAIGDNGVGLREGVDWTTTRSLGLRLVRTLAQQIGATVEFQGEPGTRFQMTFATAA